MADRVASAGGLGYRLRLGGIWLAASGLVPARWFQPPPPKKSERAARTGMLHVEIVSHCWRYAHLMAYQLSSLVNHPPEDVVVTMTVFHASEDAETVRLLEYFGAMEVPNVSWNWQARDKTLLFRRSIGRNEAALASGADWVWFTDCDVVFHEGCLDGLGKALQGSREALVYPDHEFCSPVYEPGDPVLEAAREPCLVEIDTATFVRQERTRATGPLQITHGDVARACGYCRDIPVYQQPTDRWAKAQEDRAFRWLLGTGGKPVEIPSVYRIRHQAKGRYRRRGVHSRLRTRVRQAQLRVRERGNSADADQT
ncbi:MULTISPECIES: glycosyltransferase family A protein [unclassified Wenzhouxiangella]|uniref:glycosyltransferase family A protein n=1 Tax=unclassified Wenzhouxiangella TaxID=2613841 RepID=UPI000E328C59|nr:MULTISPECIES: glycosyltransferase family A protein [unclassified Wenzhouxiangella]RFF27510.1 glycosyltransferase family 2 protein [Wenzhouxiangella sp. 15181]RFP69628.1 glycosyltransferase family 2 protein [Wenzhouxiangella sp. 15190]